METTIRRLSETRIEMTVVCPSAECAERAEAKLADLSRTVRIPGFRPGKAPVGLVRKRLWPGIVEEVIEEQIRDTIRPALDRAGQEIGRRIVGSPVIIERNWREGGDFSYTVLLENEPRIGEVNYTGLTVERAEPSISETRLSAMVEEHIQTERRRQAVASEVTDRDSVEAGDWIDCSVETRFDGELQKPFSGDHMTLVAGPENAFHPDMGERLVGLKRGEAAAFQVAFGPDSGLSSFRGRTVDFTVKVHGIRRVELPEMSDQFASSAGPFKTMLEWRLAIAEGIRAEERDVIGRDLRRSLVDRLVEANPIEVPMSLVEAQFEGLQQEIGERFRRMGMPGFSPRGEALEELRRKAERDVRFHYLSEAIAVREGLTIGEQERQAWFEKVARQAGVELSEVTKKYSEKESLDELDYQLRQEKLLDFIEAHSNIVAKGPEPAADSADAG